MRRHLDAGVSAAQAARLALAETAIDAGGEPQTAGLERLALGGLRRASIGSTSRVRRRASIACSRCSRCETVLRDVVLPYLRELGERWERGEATVAQEHFASNVLRGRLLGLARGWGQGTGPGPCSPVRRASSTTFR